MPLPGSRPPAAPAAALAAALRLVARRTGADAVQVYRTGDVRACVARLGEGPDLSGLAPLLGEAAAALDLAGVAEGWPAAAGLCRGSVAVVALARSALAGDWQDALGDAADVLASLLSAEARPRAPEGSAAAHAAARRRAEAFASALPVAAGAVALDAERVLRIGYATPAAAASFGRDVTGEPLANLVGAAALGGLRDAFWQALRGQPPEPVVAEGQAASGGRSFEWRLSGLGRASGQVAFVAVDVTARRVAEAEAEASRARAAAAAASRRALLAHLDHALRSPLTSVMGYADLLDPQASPDDLADIREVLLRSGERLLGSLDELCDLALADGADVPVAAVPTDAAALVRAVVDAHRSAAAARQIALALHDATAPARLLFDPALVGRVLRHLVAAAVARPGARHVDARLTEQGRELVFRIGVREPEPAAAPDDGLGAEVVQRLAHTMGGCAERGDGPRWHWTVRLPRRAVRLVELPERADAGAERADEPAALPLEPA